jgi:hypothetical protein
MQIVHDVLDDSLANKGYPVNVRIAGDRLTVSLVHPDDAFMGNPGHDSIIAARHIVP